MSTAHPIADRDRPAALPVPHLSFDEFTAFGPRALMRADIPVVITLPASVQAISRDDLVARFGDMPMTLFTEPSSRNNVRRWTTSEIRLREFFVGEKYLAAPGTWHRIVSNIRKSPAEINAVLGFDAEELFDYRRAGNAANLWVSHRGVFTQSHFDELENFNIALEGRKRFVLAPPGSRAYYPRSVLRGFGDKSQVFDFDAASPRRFPRLAAMLARRRELTLGPGQMLYLPLGWWHQAESLDEININVNFWLNNWKIFRQPYVFGVALYTAAYRWLRGVYNYQPAKAVAEDT